MEKFSQENLNTQDLANKCPEHHNIELTEAELNYIRNDAEVTYEVYKQMWHDRFVRRLRTAAVIISAGVAIAFILIMYTR